MRLLHTVTLCIPILGSVLAKYSSQGSGQAYNSAPHPSYGPVPYALGTPPYPQSYAGPFSQYPGHTDSQMLSSPHHTLAKGPMYMRYNNSNPRIGTIPDSIGYSGPTTTQVGDLSLRVIFTNDIHGREDGFNYIGTDCNELDYEERRCYGGVSRMKTLFDSLRAGHKNTLVVDAGDQFQGTMFYSRYKGNTTARFMNALGYDVMTIGNHEFDNGPIHLANFFSQLAFPVVCSNLDLTSAPKLRKWVKPYVIYPEYNLGIVGFITVTTEFISEPGTTVKFLDPATEVQKYIDILHSMGVKRIIALSHNGYKYDQEVAGNTTGIAMIVGGHSHTYLSTNYPNDPDSKGPYPTRVLNKGGRYTYIVQAKKFGEYVGYIDLTLSADGDMRWLAGEPVHMTMDIPQDPYFQKQVEIWRKEFDLTGGKVLNRLDVDLEQTPCKTGECLLGNVFTDAMLKAGSEFNPQIAIMNSDGMRSGIRKGNVNLNHILSVTPFNNYLVYMDLKGKEIRDSLVGAVTEIHPADNKPVTVFIQYSGLKMTFNPKTQKILEVKVRSSNSPTGNGQGAAENWVDLDDNQTYRVVTVEFVAGGGDHLLVTSQSYTRITKVQNVLYEYLTQSQQLKPQLDGRMVAIK
ncbi:hypothetical protein IWQ61_009629 [Dispira simplex]|nr:hypothetical protein IWQ61_009629 [Dispira simplex]